MKSNNIKIQFRDAVYLKKGTINPNAFPREEFDYYSIPSYDISAGSEKTLGKKIMSNKFLLESDCVLISKLNPRIPRICLAKVNTYKRAICSTEFVPLMVKDEKTDLEYLSHYLLSPLFQKRFQAISGGSTNSHSRVVPREILNFDFYRPPLSEQKKIAEILSVIDKGIENIENKIKKLLNLQEGMKNDLLNKGYGHKDFRESKIGRIPKSWEVKSLRDICEKITDRDHTTPIYVNANEGIPIISPTNINSDMELDLSKLKYISKEAHLKNRKKTDLMPDDIIFSRIGAALGKSYLIKKSFYDFSILHSICQIRVKDNFVYPNYVLWQMRKSLFQNSLWLGVQSIGVPDLGLGEIGKLKIPICSLQEQKEITNYLEKMHLQILQLKEKLIQTKSLKKSLMQDLLEGEVRVHIN